MFKEENEKIRNEILVAANALPDDRLNTKPTDKEWSPMQILEHLHLMETVIATNISKQLLKEDSKKAMKKPIQMTVNRAIKVDAPEYVTPSEEYITLSEMEQRLTKSRELLNGVYDTSTDEILSAKSMPHPVFGKVPLTQWFPFIGYHEKRHLKQLEEAINKINQENLE
ncbi:MAG TPA: DinB family protein [Planococcus sp. (in: firmicutes)]|nr:DinB family protein [Planococcus sp. (in: firmicutes)]